MDRVELGLRENLGQFSLLVLVNAFVGAMVGMERSILPPIAEHEFQLAATHGGAVVHRRLRREQGADELPRRAAVGRVGRKHVLVAGWLVASPVPFLLMWAPSWSWVLAANALLGVSQGLTWSTTVIMKIDSGRAASGAGSRWGSTSSPATSPSRSAALATGFDRREVRPAPAAVLSRRRLRGDRPRCSRRWWCERRSTTPRSSRSCSRALPTGGHALAARGVLAHLAARPEPLVA